MDWSAVVSGANNMLHLETRTSSRGIPAEGKSFLQISDFELSKFTAPELAQLSALCDDVFRRKKPLTASLAYSQVSAETSKRHCFLLLEPSTRPHPFSIFQSPYQFLSSPVSTSSVQTTLRCFGHGGKGTKLPSERPRPRISQIGA